MTFQVLRVESAWPAFFICIFFFAYNLDKTRLKEIFAGAFSGIIIGYTIPLALGILIPTFGPLVGFNIFLFAVLFIIIGLKPVAHTFLNPVTFTYALMSLIHVKEVTEKAIEWGIVMFLGGALLIFGLVGILSMLSRNASNKVLKEAQKQVE